MRLPLDRRILDGMLGQSMEGALPWQNMVQWMESVLPILHQGVVLVVFFWVIALLPLSVLRRMHPLIGRILSTSSLFIGGVCWWQSIIVAYRLLGWLATISALLCAGLGVVPIALFASAAKGQWVMFENLAVALMLTLIPRIVAKLIANREARLRLSASARSYSVDYYS